MTGYFMLNGRQKNEYSASVVGTYWGWLDCEGIREISS